MEAVRITSLAQLCDRFDRNEIVLALIAMPGCFVALASG
jgi:hypothetical protein